MGRGRTLRERRTSTHDRPAWPTWLVTDNAAEEIVGYDVAQQHDRKRGALIVDLAAAPGSGGSGPGMPFLRPRLSGSSKLTGMALPCDYCPRSAVASDVRGSRDGWARLP